MTAPVTEFEIQDHFCRAKRQLFISAGVLLLGAGMWLLSSLMGEGPFHELLLIGGIALAGFGLAGVVGFSIVVGFAAAAYYMYRRENSVDDNDAEHDR